MNPQKYAITFACYNQVEYTKKCIESMVEHGIDLSRLAIVDNASSDETRSYLKSLPLGAVILNQANYGCGVAWNQGILALQAEWTIVMNNDVLISKDWLENLISAAEKHQLKVISPSLIEGELDYDFNDFANQASVKMKDAMRLGGRHAVCLAIHKSVWLDVGFFQATPKLLGYEDTLFFHQLAKAGVAVGMTGSSWLHHFGSMTLSLMKQEQGLAQKAGLGSRYNYRLLQQSWLARKLGKMKRKAQLSAWKNAELKEYGMTMHGTRKNGDFVWGAAI